jgi:hypothetical protein
VDLAARLDGMARAMERRYGEGRVTLPAQFAGKVPVWLAIAAALDEQDARRERSRRPRNRKGRSGAVTPAGPMAPPVFP